MFYHQVIPKSLFQYPSLFLQVIIQDKFLKNNLHSLDWSQLLMFYLYLSSTEIAGMHYFPTSSSFFT